MAAFDYPVHLERDYRARLRTRVEAAKRTIDDALEKLKRAERADPDVWENLLREAERAYKSAFDTLDDIELAQETVERIVAYNRTQWETHKPDDVEENPTALNMNPDRVREWVQDQLDSMRALIRRYYDRLKDPETDEDGLVIVPLLFGAAATAKGISDRRAAFYARDQHGDVNGETAERIAKQMGYDAYEWLRTTADNPRERHLGRVGKIYKFSEPPPGGHPGSEHNCQCGARPVRR